MADTLTSNNAVTSASTREQDISEELLRLIHDLVIELRPKLKRGLDVRLDSHLDRDLGFDSLTRAELLIRVDRNFHVRLPDRLISDAETPQDLLTAILAAAPSRGYTTERKAPVTALLPKTDEPVRARTLTEALAAHVEMHPDRPHLIVWKSEEEEETITYAQLEMRARAVAGGLLNLGLQPGDRVTIMLPSEAGFFYAFFGVLAAGGVPVPIYPPFRRSQVEDHLRRQAGIINNCEAGILITNEEIKQVGRLLFGLAEPLRHIAVVSELLKSEPIERFQPLKPEALGLIQYTSGSTGDPKGVMLTHANLLANIRSMGDAMEATSSDVFISWLPTYHDMGLIGAWLAPLYYGAITIIMPPLAFLADPTRWLWAIHRHRGTLSAAPNFAYELCTKNIRDHDIEGLDLSSMRRTINGAEPVSPSTVRDFIKRFSAYGFNPEALAPSYGLAENCVGLAFPPLNRGPLIDKVDRDALMKRGIATSAKDDDPHALEFVACGRPLPRNEIRIVDDGGFEVAERRQGRLQFRGPSQTQGYFKAPEKTKAMVFGDWLDSGDRAYIASGDIYITGRIKDIIIRGGRNIYPHEIENTVGEVEGVRKGCVAAFASHDARTGTERLIVMAETRLTDPDERHALERKIMEATTALLDSPPDEVVLAPPQSVPKTSSGKIRRSAARDLFESGMIGKKPKSLVMQLLRLSASGLSHRARLLGEAAGTDAYAAWFWLTLGLIGLFVWPATLVLPDRARRKKLHGQALRLFFRVNGVALRVNSEAPWPESKAMFVVNHASYLDAGLVIAAIPGPLTFIAKEEFASQAVAGPFLRKSGVIFVRRFNPKGGLEDTESISDAARAGERIVSFPEGTFTRMPGLREFRMGAFVVAAQAGIPVIPVTIRGARSLLRSEQWFPRRGPIEIHIGEPILPSGSDFEAALRLRDAARAAILAQSGEPDLAG